MPEFIYISNASFPFNALLNAIVAISFFLGILQIGRLATDYFINFTEPWNSVLGFLLGYFLIGMTTQLFIFFSVATYFYILEVSIVIIFGLIYVPSLYFKICSIQWRVSEFKIPIVILLISIFVLFIVSLAPSTKIDELNYHMLVPARMHLDDSLNFYKTPWEGSIYPGLFYQIFQLPFLKIGLPDVPNTLSFLIFSLLLWFSGFLIKNSTDNYNQSVLWWILALMPVGMYSVVYLVTAGGSSLLVFSVSIALIAVVYKDVFFKKTNIYEWIFICQLLLLGMVTSKVSTFPLAILLNTIVFFKIFEVEKRIFKACVYLLIPWVVFYLPILIWSYTEIGSFSGIIFNGGDNSLYKQSLNGLIGYKGEIKEILLFTFLYWSPAIWIALIFIISSKYINQKTRFLIFVLFIVQFLLIVYILPNKARHFSGMQYFFIIAFGLIAVKYTQINKRLVKFLGVLLTVPWLCIQIYYSAPFFGIVFGITDEVVFYKKYIPYYDDFVYLDRSLPEKSQFIAVGARLNHVHFPRRVYADISYIDKNLPLYLFYVGEDEVLYEHENPIYNPNLLYIREGDILYGDEVFKLCNLIYENNQAVKYTYRTPGKKSAIDKLRVFEICLE